MTHSELNTRWSQVRTTLMQYISDGDVVMADSNLSPALKEQRIDQLTDSLFPG